MQQAAFLSYSEILLKMLGGKVSDQAKDYSGIEPLAFLPYPRELLIKNQALLEFWKRNRLDGKPDAIAASPKPRYYRTTTKRRVFFAHGKFRLRFSHHKDATPDMTMLCSELEPKAHEDIYRFLAEKINSPGFSVAAKHLTYIIIRGTYTEFCVIFNVDRVDGRIVRNLKALAGNLRALDLNIMSSFIFFDPTRSDYYLEKKPEGRASAWKKLFGPDTLRLRVNGRTYLFEPGSFSQINESMLPAFLDAVARLCSPIKEARLIDLYCGYGLFANYLGGKFGETYAVDIDSASIKCGSEGARYMARIEKSAVRIYFREAPITPSSLESLLPPPTGQSETILLDPPRNGPGKGVIAFCARRQPERIVHLFCDIDRIPIDLQEWDRYGYRVADVVPFDMFPGTPDLEVAVLLVANAVK